MDCLGMEERDNELRALLARNDIVDRCTMFAMAEGVSLFLGGGSATEASGKFGQGGYVTV